MNSNLLWACSGLALGMLFWAYFVEPHFIINKYRKQNKELQDAIDECIEACEEANNILSDPKVQEAVNQIR